MPPSRGHEASLLGREAELAELTERLAAPGALVTLIGPPGAGTSRLARHAAAQTFTRSRIVDVDQLSAMSSDEARGLELLVVDDVDERVTHVVSVLGPLRGAAPDLRVLLAGDEALAIDDEVVMAIDVLTEDAAVRLYTELASPASAEDEVRALVRRLRGLPLAVELAALQAGTFAARDLLGEAVATGERSIDLGHLRSARRDRPARRASMTAAFDVAWNALGEAERRALMGIATFTEPPGLEALDLLLEGPGASDPLRLLETLVARSLVRRVSSGLALAPLLLDDVRARMRKLHASDASDATVTALAIRHAEILVARMEGAARQAYGPDAVVAYGTMKASLPEVRAAFARVQSERPDLAARLVVPLGDLAVFAEGVPTDDPLFAAALVAADASGDGELRARARNVQAKMLLERNEAESAQRVLEEARGMGNGMGNDVTLLADLDRTTGWTCLALQDLDAGVTALERALAGYAKTRSPRGQADAFAALGVIARLRGDEAAALRLLGSSYGIHVVAGDAVRQGKLREMASLLGVDLPELPAAEVDLSTLRAVADEHRASTRPWRDAIARLELSRRLAREGQTAASRASLVEARASAQLAGGRADWIASLEGQALAQEVRGWHVGPNAGISLSPEGVRVDLRTRAVLRRVFAALVAARRATPGRAIGVEGILATGWPGERVQHAAGLLRVYTAIKRLRALGLGPLLRTTEEGYLLDPHVPLTVSEMPLD